MLSATQQMDLLKKYRQYGDLEARNKLVEANSALVMAVCKKYHCYDCQLLDLFQEGIIGLITACDKYRLDSEMKFTTYAVFCIKNAVAKFLRKETGYSNKFQDLETIRELPNEYENVEDDALMKVEVKKVICIMDRSLTKREKKMLLDRSNSKSVKEICREQGITRQRAWQIINGANNKIKMQL